MRAARTRRESVLSNLLSNAMQCGSHGAAVRVGGSGDPKAVTLAVWDDGFPIPADGIRMIFDPLTRMVAENAAPTSGNLGPGLHITKEVVVAHGGTIEVMPSEAKGTIVTACFPRLRPGPVLPDIRQPA